MKRGAIDLDEKVFQVDDNYPYCNLSIRDVFAAFVLAGAGIGLASIVDRDQARATMQGGDFAKIAYGFADAMMAERGK